MLAQTLEQRGRMLKLMSMNLYDIGLQQPYMKNLVEFKNGIMFKIRDRSRILS